MKRIIVALICLLVAGCTSDMPPKIETQIVKVEVPVKAAAPRNLVDIPEYGPLPEFKSDPAHPDWVYLDSQGQKFLRDLFVLMKGRDDAWRAFYSPE